MSEEQSEKSEKEKYGAAVIEVNIMKRSDIMLAMAAIAKAHEVTTG